VKRCCYQVKHREKLVGVTPSSVVDKEMLISNHQGGDAIVDTKVVSPGSIRPRWN